MQVETKENHLAGIQHKDAAVAKKPNQTTQCKESMMH